MSESGKATPDPQVNLALEAGHCAVWVTRAPQRSQPSHAAVLSSKEHHAMHRLATEPLRARYACAHAMLRHCLGAVLGHPPEALHLEPGRNRRPQLLHPKTDIDFNLSYSADWVALVIGRRLRVGIDIEMPTAHFDPAPLIPKVLSDAEKQALGERSPHAMKSLFYRIWTLKEACAKVHGEGLGLDFSRMTLLPTGRSMQLNLEELKDRRGRWHCYELTQGKADEPALSLAVLGKPKVTPDLQLDPPAPAPDFDCCPVRIRSVGSIAVPQGLSSPA